MAHSKTCSSQDAFEANGYTVLARKYGIGLIDFNREPAVKLGLLTQSWTRAALPGRRIRLHRQAAAGSVAVLHNQRFMFGPTGPRRPISSNAMG